MEKQKIKNPADTPKEVFEFWHDLWAAYLNKHYRSHFVKSGVCGHSFTERTPDSPNGTGSFNYSFTSDGTLQFKEVEGEAIVEYDSYEIGHRALADPDVDAGQLMKEGKLRFTQNTELFKKLIPLIPLMREAYYAIIGQVEEKYNVEMPKYV